ncbi:hypothetical protein GJAV_G00015450 [Gymnothorax javanicus]|nr:hypothetical protein GJAV_G00015450 [Gymnothorax javanicus]
MNKVLLCMVLAFMVLQIMAAASKTADGSNKVNNGTSSENNSGSQVFPAPLLVQLGMAVVPALLYKLL